jgi:lipoprotein-anchoring transpeptidase ErfK/SrfK
VLAVSACTPVASWDIQTVPPSEQSKATISALPAGAKRVDPGQRIVVTATDGQLADVTVLGPKGPLKGSLSADGTIWTARKAGLDYGATYTVQATAVDPRGVPTTHSDTFRTVEPKDFFAGTVSPREGATVGVGMPIIVTFDHAIKNKAEVERALVVRTPEPLLGAWSWSSDSTVQFRPKKHWPGNIGVTVDLNLKGIEASKGIYGQSNASTSFSIGTSLVIKVNAESHQAKVIRDGENVRTIPITTGKGGFETRSGTVLIVSKERTRIMDAATGGTDPADPEYYRLEVEYAMRITYSGEFLHAAPWSVGSQGYANVSHGCIGMSTSNAQWLFDQATIGDIVEITGTSVPQNLGNGITVWTQTWDEWLAGSTTGAVTTVATTPATPAPSGTTDPSTTPAPGTSAPGLPDAASTPAPTPAPSSTTARTTFRR